MNTGDGDFFICCIGIDSLLQSHDLEIPTSIHADSVLVTKALESLGLRHVLARYDSLLQSRDLENPPSISADSTKALESLGLRHILGIDRENATKAHLSIAEFVAGIYET